MIVLGLTGSIGMGKTATAQMFREEAIPVYDADAAVHALYQVGGAGVGPIGARFENVVVEGAIDRSKLRNVVLNDTQAMKDLEGIVHPLVGQTQAAFRKKAAAENARLIVLDIPLLFETGGDGRCDYTITVTASKQTQRRRVLGRAGMTEEAFEAILEKQLPDAEKRARADFIISSEFGFEFARDMVRAIIKACMTITEADPND